MTRPTQACTSSTFLPKKTYGIAVKKYLSAPPSSAGADVPSPVFTARRGGSSGGSHWAAASRGGCTLSRRLRRSSGGERSSSWRFSVRPSSSRVVRSPPSCPRPWFEGGPSRSPLWTTAATSWQCFPRPRARTRRSCGGPLPRRSLRAVQHAAIPVPLTWITRKLKERPSEFNHLPEEWRRRAPSFPRSPGHLAKLWPPPSSRPVCPLDRRQEGHFGLY
eukprot:scaffold150_cov204-Pinguiococcus_pyrenoidosus.AAC.1